MISSSSVPLMRSYHCDTHHGCSQPVCITPPNDGLALVGPSGRNVDVTLAGGWLSAVPEATRSGFRLRLMEQCGTDSGVDGAAIASADSLGLSYAFGLVTAQGGDYELCWCVGLPPVECVFNADFGRRVGSLELHGPTGDAWQSCVKDTPCPAISIRGQGLKGGDLVLVRTRTGDLQASDCRASEGWSWSANRRVVNAVRNILNRD